MLMRILVMVCAVLLATPVYAGSKIDLVQSDGSIVPMGGVGNAANVTLSGGSVSITTLASSVTTNTTSAAVAVPRGNKSIYGQVVGTGAVTQTQAIYGDVDNDAANGVLLCTITLSDTNRAQDACPVITANFSYYYVVTTATSGTSATGSIYAMY